MLSTSGARLGVRSLWHVGTCVISAYSMAATVCFSISNTLAHFHSHHVAGIGSTPAWMFYSFWSSPQHLFRMRWRSSVILDRPSSCDFSERSLHGRHSAYLCVANSPVRRSIYLKTCDVACSSLTGSFTMIAARLRCVGHDFIVRSMSRTYEATPDAVELKVRSMTWTSKSNYLSPVNSTGQFA